MTFGKKPAERPKPTMALYRLSDAARLDLMDIAAYGDQNWGRSQSDSYRERLKQRFELLANEPMLYQAVDHIQEGYRRSVCGAHSIYYRVSDDGVDIMRVLRSQDTSGELPDST